MILIYALRDHRTLTRKNFTATFLLQHKNVLLALLTDASSIRICRGPQGEGGMSLKVSRRT